MKRFVIKSVLLVAINVAIALGVILVVDARQSFEQWQTDSILYVIPKGQSFDFVALGTSRGRVFSEFKANHDFVTQDLGLRFLNLAVPFGGGILPEKMFLEYFFDRGNQTRAVVLLLDPFMLFNEGSNLYHRFVFYEPFRVGFVIKLFQNRIPIQRIITYVRSKFGHYWFIRATPVKDRDPRVVSRSADEAEMKQKRMDSLYPDGVSRANFARYAQDVLAVFDLAQRRGARMIVVMPPTLLGQEPGAQETRAFLEAQRTQYDFVFRDFTDAMPEDRFFADHDHLNSKGFKHFMREYLAPLLKAPEDRTPS